MSAMAIPAGFTHREANEPWRADLRPIGWLMLFSLLLHLLLLWRLTGGEGYEVAHAEAPAEPISIRLQEEQTEPHRTSSVTHPRQPPTYSAPSVARQPVAEAAVDASAQTEAAVSDVPPAPPDAAPAVNGPTQAEQEEAYLAQVRALIESHKFYPGAARRRGIEGTVQVSFVVNPDGSVSQVICSGGARLLQYAAEEALRNAAPFPVQQGSDARPLQVRYETTFALN